MPESGFTVVDVETTGLIPEMNDRVIEIALVRTDEHGETIDTWETLINPGRDLGPQRIHGIRGADVADAPPFSDVLPDIVDRLDGRAMVAHNASFDTRFLVAELTRAGYQLAHPPVALCTMQLARRFLPGAGRSLLDCCDAYGIVLEGSHRALVDALATSQLLASYIRSSRSDRDFWEQALSEARAAAWPRPVRDGVHRPPKVRPDLPHELTTAGFLERISDKLPDHDGPEETREYLALLDRALADRYIAIHEAEALVQLAEMLGISRESVRRLHHEYFQTLVTVAWADSELTTEELTDITMVAHLLDVPEELVQSSIATPTGEVASTDFDEFRLEPGDLVVLTGEMTRPRTAIEDELRRAGFVPWDAVTKKVKVLAAADPDSASGKARKARDYGIPVIGEEALYRLAFGR